MATKSKKIGDVNSNKKGSGARFNNSKPDYSLIFLEDLIALDNCKDELTECLCNLSVFQKYEGKEKYLNEAFLYACSFMLNEYDMLENEFWMEPVIRVWEYGKNKYSAWNWACGMRWSIPIACIARHYIAHRNGEKIDEESGQSHIAHIICNLQMLRYYIVNYPEGNDLVWNVIED